MKLPGDSSWNHPQLSSSFHKSEISVLIIDLKTGLNISIYKKKQSKTNKTERSLKKKKNTPPKPLKRKQPKKIFLTELYFIF